MTKKLLLHSIPPSTIESLYFVDNKSRREIAIMFGCSEVAVRNFMNKHGIPARSLSEANSIVANSPDVQSKRRKKLCGKPSGATGKTWKHAPDSLVVNMDRSGSKNPGWKGGVSSDKEHLKQQRKNHKAIRRGKSPHMPAWANKERIAEIYKEAREKGLTVDHIVPLNNKLVCGLHCEDNMQLLTLEENVKKNNSFSV